MLSHRTWQGVDAASLEKVAAFARRHLILRETNPQAFQ